MRLIGCLLVMLLGLSWLASQLPVVETLPGGEPNTGEGHKRGPSTNILAKCPGVSAPDSKTAWRRTRDGWEHPSWWTSDRGVHRPALHPIVVGLLEIFLTLAALITFSESSDRRPHPKPKPAPWPNLPRRSDRAPAGRRTHGRHNSPQP